MGGDGEVCPRCARPGVPLRFGLIRDPDVLQAADEGRLVLGGCMVPAPRPDRQCPDGHRWASHPVDKSPDGRDQPG